MTSQKPADHVLDEIFGTYGVTGLTLTEFSEALSALRRAFAAEAEAAGTARYNALAAQIAQNRKAFVVAFATARIDRREGEATVAEIAQWEHVATQRWNEMYPNLAAALGDAR